MRGGIDGSCIAGNQPTIALALANQEIIDCIDGAITAEQLRGKMKNGPAAAGDWLRRRVGSALPRHPRPFRAGVREHNSSDRNPNNKNGDAARFPVMDPAECGAVWYPAT